MSRAGEKGTRWWAPRAVVFFLVLLSLSVVGAKDKKKWDWEEWREFWGEKKEEELRPVEEVFAEAEEYFQGRMAWYGRPRRDFIRAKELYREVVDNYPFSRYGPKAELRVADCHFHLEEYEEAAVWYEQFVRKHARSEDAPYAMFQLGMCHLNQMAKPGRDQEHTRQALVHFELLRERFPASAEAAEAEDKIQECRRRLAQHELLVGDFYFKRKDYWAAAARYHGIWQNYAGSGLEAEAMLKEGECYEKLGKRDLARSLYEQTASQFPSASFGRKAADRLQEMEKK